MLLALQVRCAMELMAWDEAHPRPEQPPSAEVSIEGGEAGGVVHVFEFVDALTGEAVRGAEVGALVPAAFAGDRALFTEALGGDLGAVGRVITLPSSGEYSLRFEGGSSQRWFGCEATLPAAGRAPRRVRVSLVPRARDVSVRVRFVRDRSERELPSTGLDAVELHATAGSERELEVFRGACSGERMVGESRWCVRSSAAQAGVTELSVRVPGFAAVPVQVAMSSAERVIAVTARFASHLWGAFVARLGVSVGVFSGEGVGGVLAVEVRSPSRVRGAACALGSTCVVPALHLGAMIVSYSRTTTLSGPGDLSRDDNVVSASLGGLEVGGGVTVVPAGTGDRLRLTALASMAVLYRGEERADGVVYATPSGRVGGVFEALSAVRIAGPLTGWFSLRALWLPWVGSQGRRFSLLGDATVSQETAPLVQISLQAGLGIEL